MCATPENPLVTSMYSQSELMLISPDIYPVLGATWGAYRSTPTLNGYSQEVLWAACRAIAQVAETRAQWDAFVEEVPAYLPLSNSLAQRLPAMAETIWARVRGAGQ